MNLEVTLMDNLVECMNEQFLQICPENMMICDHAVLVWPSHVTCYIVSEGGSEGVRKDVEE